MSNPSDNPYQAPSSEGVDLADQLLLNQNLLGTAVGTVSGLVPGLIVAALLAQYPFVAFLIPGIAAGLLARFCGRGIEFKHALLCALLTFLVSAAFQYYLFQNLSSILVLIPSAIVAAYLSKRRLKRDESDAIYRRLTLKKSE